MPDWVTHLGTAYIVTRVSRLEDVRLFLLGAVLPDMTRFSIALVHVLHIPPVETFSYFAPFHSLFLVFLVSVALALIHENPKKCLALVFGGALLHFFLDVLDADLDCGLWVLYPFCSQRFSLGLLRSEAASLSLLAVSMIALLVAVFERGKFPRTSFRVKNFRFALPLVLLVVVLPWFTRGLLVANNIHYLDFFTQPTEWENQQVEFCFSEVVSSNPVVVEEMGQRFQVVTAERLEKGEWISMRGVYRGGKVYPTMILEHKGFFEIWISLAGLVAFVTIWFNPSRKLIALRRWVLGRFS